MYGHTEFAISLSIKVSFNSLVIEYFVNGNDCFSLCLKVNVINHRRTEESCSSSTTSRRSNTGKMEEL